MTVFFLLFDFESDAKIDVNNFFVGYKCLLFGFARLTGASLPADATQVLENSAYVCMG